MRPRHDFVAKTQVGFCSVFRLITIKIPNHNPKFESFSTTSLNEKNRSIFKDWLRNDVVLWTRTYNTLCYRETNTFLNVYCFMQTLLGYSSNVWDGCTLFEVEHLEKVSNSMYREMEVCSISTGKKHLLKKITE